MELKWEKKLKQECASLILPCHKIPNFPPLYLLCLQSLATPEVKQTPLRPTRKYKTLPQRCLGQCQEHGIFLNFFFVYFHNFLPCFISPTLLSLSFTFQEKTIRVLLIP